MPSIFQTQFPTKDIRDIGLEAGRPSAFASLSGDLSREVADSGQSRAFGLALMDLLKQYQGVEKYPFKEQGFQAQEEQARRRAFTPEELIGASPGLQAGTRGAEVEALQPTVTGSRVAGQTFASQLETFGDVLGQARLIQQGIDTAASRAKDDARAVIKDALTFFGGGAFGTVDPKELAGLERLAGYPKGFLLELSKTLKEKEAERKTAEAPKTLETDQGIFQWDPNQRKWTATGLTKTGLTGTGGSNVDIYARDVLQGKITLSSVPDKLQTQVSVRVSELKKTDRTLNDEEIRAFLRQKKTTKNGLPREKGELRDLIIRDKTITEPDRQRFFLILDEMMPDVKPEEGGFLRRLFGK